MAEAGVNIGIRDGGESSIYLLFGSTDSPKAAALFEVKLRNSGEEEGDGDEIYAENPFLKPIQTFYDQTIGKPIGYVVCVPLGRGEYFVFPNQIVWPDWPNEIISSETLFPPCIFDAKTMATHRTAKSPLRPKDTPLAATVGNKVYVLCRPTTSRRKYYIPFQSSFEAYDPDNNSLESLDTPWFNITNGLVRHYPIGFAVVGECIIVCLEDSYPVPEYSPFYSYNTTSKKWRYVRLSPLVSVSHEQNKLIWYGEAVFKDGFIYGYVLPCHGLASFSCTMPSEEDPFITIGLPSFVNNFKYPHWDNRVQPSCAVALIENDLLCVVHTAPITFGSDHLQPVLMSLLRITKPGTCTTIKVLDLFMPRQDVFHSANVTSCLVMQPGLDTSTDYKEGHGGKKPVLRT